jgi:hypothetical protein
VSGRPAAGAAVAAALATALLAGAGPGPHTGAASAVEDTVRLTVTFTRRPGAGHVARLRCTGARASADGFLRAAGAGRACAHARRIAGFLAAKPDPRRACTEIYGGPERARVAGQIGARRIGRVFSRTDGCGIADWRRAMPLLPRPG